LPSSSRTASQDYLLGIEIRKIGDTGRSATQVSHCDRCDCEHPGDTHLSGPGATFVVTPVRDPVTGGAVMFSALVELDTKSPQHPFKHDDTLAASVTDGSTGAVLRAGIGEEAEPGGGTLMDYRDMSWSLELEFHVDVFLLRKSDGKILSLCAGTSRCDSKQDETDSLARRMHDINPDKKSTEYCWLIPGTVPTMVMESPSFPRGSC
jgi:hypothetical protein